MNVQLTAELPDRARTGERGHVVFVALMFVLISLGFTSGYLRFVMGERLVYNHRLAVARAKYNAYTGLSKEAVPFIQSPHFTTTDTLLEDRAEQVPFMHGGYDTVMAKIEHRNLLQRKYFTAAARGFSSFPTWDGLEFEVDYWATANFRPRGFEEFMYLTNEETPGGGPWLGSYVSFGANDVLEGIVFSNDDMTMSSYGCPQFVGSENPAEPAQIYTAGNFIMNGCPESIFGAGGEAVWADSVEPVAWPPYEGHDRVRENADWLFHNDSRIDITNPGDPDQHIMAWITFEPGQFNIKRWAYTIPPYVKKVPGDPGYAQFLDTLKRFYPLYYRDNYFDPGAFTGNIEFDHFFFQPITDSNHDDFVEDRTIVADEGVIWIDGGQCWVEGEVRGRYTVATSRGTEYRMRHDSTQIMELRNNIWIVNDLYFEDRTSQGRIPLGSLNRMGLLSGGNVIIANTAANGGRAQNWGTDVVIHAAIIAMDESFIVHYWNNSTGQYNGIDGGQVKGDGRFSETFRWRPGWPTPGPIPTTGTDDIRGVIKLHGSIIQEKRGYVKRNSPGPYQISPGIGYDKAYKYDFNLRNFPPPHWPETRNEDGSASLVLDNFSVGKNKPL